MDTTKPTIICLMGPTACGKTAVSSAIAKVLPCEIISVDSALVYRGCDIGSAKPSVEEREAIPHWLVDICEPYESFSAGDFCDYADEAIQVILSKNKTPFLVGGTMLYFKRFLHGFAELPESDPNVRSELEKKANEIGWQAMHDELRVHDPKAAARIHPNDRQRILRALEVLQITSTPISQLQADTQSNNAYRAINIIIEPHDRRLLHAKIKERLQVMFDNGFVEEVSQLRGCASIHADLPSMKSVGYRQVWEHLEGECSLSEAFDKALYATRQLAKRQITWLRRWPDGYRFGMEDPKLVDKIMAVINDKMH